MKLRQQIDRFHPPFASFKGRQDRVTETHVTARLIAHKTKRSLFLVSINTHPSRAQKEGNEVQPWMESSNFLSQAPRPPTGLGHKAQHQVRRYTIIDKTSDPPMARLLPWCAPPHYTSRTPVHGKGKGFWRASEKLIHHNMIPFSSPTIGHCVWWVLCGWSWNNVSFANIARVWKWLFALHLFATSPPHNHHQAKKSRG